MGRLPENVRHGVMKMKLVSLLKRREVAILAIAAAGLIGVFMASLPVQNTHPKQHVQATQQSEIILSYYQPKYPLLEYWRYPNNTCELAAMQFQKVYGGDLIFLQPLNSGGSYNFGPYKGHWINYVWYEPFNRSYYIDYVNQRVFNTKDEVTQFEKKSTGTDYVLYDVNKETVPFPIIHHY